MTSRFSPDWLIIDSVYSSSTGLRWVQPAQNELANTQASTAGHSCVRQLCFGSATLEPSNEIRPDLEQ